MPSTLVLGSGGREAAIAWKLRQDGGSVYISPGNGGEQTQLPDLSTKTSDLLEFCTSHGVDLVVVGPEVPLCRGIVDEVTASSSSIAVFGPTKKAAAIEGSKEFSKELMTRHGIPTAEYGTFTTIEQARAFIESKSSWSGYVVKADGLAAGKGVVVTKDATEAVHAAKSMLQGEFGTAGSRILVENMLDGYEISALCFTDGHSIKRMPLARDHKRLLEGDCGPNTGGMGVIAPVTVSDDVDQQIDDILQRTVRGMREEGREFRGVLYAGLMVSPTGKVNVLEFNARFGDPETEVLLPLLASPLLPILKACVSGTLDSVDIRWREHTSACGVILAGKAYPAASDRGTIISEVPENTDDTIVFHCGTKKDGQKLLTNGGRIICLTALGTDLDQARAKAITVADRIHFDGKQFRRDIGVLRNKSIPSCGSPLSGHGSSSQGQGMSYGDSGVDVTAGMDFVEGIKEIVGRTKRPGTDEIGGFGAVLDLAKAGFCDKPQLVVGIDGVGTKIEVCDIMNDYKNVGHDVVGMCANDVLCHCAEPLAFLDYYVCGRLEKKKATQVVSSIASACLAAGCALVGGETAEMPGVYGAKQWDVAGCCIGAREASWPQLPEFSRIRAGDAVIGIASNGVHSNGFSLVRTVFEKHGIRYQDKSAWDAKTSYGSALLSPTRIYVQSVLPLMKEGIVKSAAHITGGGITENAIRALSGSGTVALSIDLSTWTLPPLFAFLAGRGPIQAEEILRTFNCGVGFCLVVDKNDADNIVTRLQKAGETAWRMGEIANRNTINDPLISYRNLETFVPVCPIRRTSSTRKRCRVAVLISGTGTNMVRLVKASQREDSDAEVVLVVSNRADAGGLELAKNLGVPHVLTVPHTKDRVTGDMTLHEVLLSNSIELICLAGYMRILSPEFVSKWKERILNVHPSLLPSFKGAYAIEDALAAGAKITGCTVHYVEPEVDSGRIVAQAAVEIPEGSSAKDLHALIQEKEHKLFPQALLKVAKEFISSTTP